MQFYHINLFYILPSLLFPDLLQSTNRALVPFQFDYYCRLIQIFSSRTAHTDILLLCTKGFIGFYNQFDFVHIYLRTKASPKRKISRIEIATHVNSSIKILQYILYLILLIIATLQLFHKKIVHDFLMYNEFDKNITADIFCHFRPKHRNPNKIRWTDKCLNAADSSERISFIKL